MKDEYTKVIDKNELSIIIHDRTKYPRFSKMATVVAAIVLFIGDCIMVWIHQFSVKLCSIVGNVLIFIIFATGYYLFHRVIVEDLRYGIPTRITLYGDRMEFVSVRGLRIAVRYEDIGLIRTARTYGKSDLKYACVIYYNESLDKCIYMWIPFEVADELLNYYRRWVKSEGRRPCIIYERPGTPAEEMRMATKLEKSPFCRRRRLL